MGWSYRTFIRPVLFAQDSERIHDATLRLLAWASRHPLVCETLATFFSAPELPVEVFGLRFPNPVGLAAGMDKHADALPAWQALGFGFCELGGVTWHPQPGNPPPRLFRAVRDEALINRMGFNNPGAEAMAAKLAAWRAAGRWPRHPVGINLGKSKVTPLDQAAEDYRRSFEILWPHADFFVVNVSSPNTPNLRQLQDKTALDQILAALQEENARQATTRRRGTKLGQAGEPAAGEGSAPPHAPLQTATRPAAARPATSGRPILVKVAPDLSFPALDDILDLVGPRGIAGIVATNTTLARPETADPALRRLYAEAGGLSGRPLRARSTEVIRHLHRQTRGTLPIIGVGGIFDAADAWDKIIAGASLVQVYTGLVYEGPGIARALVSGLLENLQARGMSSLAGVVGQGLA